MFQILRQELRRKIVSGSRWRNLTSINGKYAQEEVLVDNKANTSSQEDVYSQLDPDKFGDLNQKFGPKRKSKLSEKEDPDGFDKLEIKRGIKISLPAYERIMNEVYHKRPRNTNELLRLYREMVYVDRYQPSRSIFTMLFTACAQVGYTRKAVELFYEMKRFGLWPPTKASVTSLFNACANCSNGDPAYGLENVTRIRDELESEGFQFNATHYNALIKAFAKLGDMSRARTTLKEMMAKRLTVDLDTYSMLLMGCITDRENGLFVAVSIMQKILLIPGAKLDVSTFNLFLRCIRDCNISDEDRVKKLCQKSEKRLLLARKMKNNQNKILMIENQKTDSSNLPNLLTGQNMTEIISIDFKSLDLPRNRFLLFGGLEGFLRVMDSYETRPDLKTFTLMIDLVGLEQGFEQIIEVLARYQLHPDVCLYNVLLKKYAKGQRYSKCQEIVAHMQKNNIRPDIMTFGALTFCCIRWSHAKKLLQEMKECEIIPNPQIIGSLINIACSRQDITYVRSLLWHLKSTGIRLCRIDIERIDLFLAQIKRQIVQQERNNVNDDLTKRNEMDYNETKILFEELLKESKFEVDISAWSQFESEDYHTPKKQINSVIEYMRKKIETKHGGHRNIRQNYDEPDEVD